MKPTFLVTGATGNVGSEVARALPQNKQTRLAVRNVARAEAMFGMALDYVSFDFDNVAGFPIALNGVSHLFLVRPPHLTDINIFKRFIDYAKSSGVQHIVFLSLQGIEKVSFVPHAKIERTIIESGISYTFLRAGFFMQNLNKTHRDEIVQQNDIFIPAGHSQTAFIDTRDIGAVGAIVMMQAQHCNQIYTLTGSESLNYDQVASIFSEELNRLITYSNPSFIHFIWHKWHAGMALPQALLISFLYIITRFGQASAIHPDAQNILGRQPITMRQYIKDYAHEYQPKPLS